MPKKKRSHWEPMFSDLSIATPRIVIQRNQEVQIEGCRKILIYHEHHIQIQAKEMQISLVGTHLVMETINKENVVVTGEFEKIEFIV